MKAENQDAIDASKIIKSNLKAVPVKKAAALPATNSIEDMIELAIKSDAGVDKLEKIMEMKYEYDRRESVKLFHEKFGEMQFEMPAIKKTKQVSNAYKYAPLEDIVQQIKPILHKYGFTYRWTEGLTEVKDYKRITCRIAGHGHEETSFVDIPIMEATKMTNSAQQSGSSSTYGKRYSLCGVLGIMVDDDDDGQSIAPKGQPQNKTVKAKAPTRVDILAQVSKAYNEMQSLGISNPKVTEFMKGLKDHNDNKLINGIVGMKDRIKNNFKKPEEKEAK